MDPSASVVLIGSREVGCRSFLMLSALRPTEGSMTILTARAGGGVLGKARLIAGVVACVSIGGQATQIGNVAHGPMWHAMSYAAIVALVGVAAGTFWRGRAFWFDPAVTLYLPKISSG